MAAYMDPLAQLVRKVKLRFSFLMEVTQARILWMGRPLIVVGLVSQEILDHLAHTMVRT
jgi:hypothetical protein